MSRNQKELNGQTKEERRQLILLTALKIFTRKGFAASHLSVLTVILACMTVVPGILLLLKR